MHGERSWCTTNTLKGGAASCKQNDLQESVFFGHVHDAKPARAEDNYFLFAVCFLSYVTVTEKTDAA